MLASIKIEAKRNMATIAIDGVEQKSIVSYDISQTAGKSPKVTFKMLSNEFEFEGDSEIFIIVNEKKYKLVEE